MITTETRIPLWWQVLSVPVLRRFKDDVDVMIESRKNIAVLSDAQSNLLCIVALTERGKAQASRIARDVGQDMDYPVHVIEITPDSYAAWFHEVIE